MEPTLIQPLVVEPEPREQLPTPIPTLATDLALIRTELNFDRYPIFTTSKYKAKSREIVEVAKTPHGEIIERRVIIGKTDKGVEVGTLGTSHQKTFYLLQHFWQQAGYPEKTTLSLYQLIKHLKLNRSGKTRRLVKGWLADLRQIPITWFNSFYDAELGDFRLTDYRTVLSYLVIAEYKKGEPTKAAAAFTLDENIRRNLLARHTHPLLIDVYISFKSEYAQLLYPYIDRRLAKTTSFEATLTNLWQFLGLSNDAIRYPAERKAKLQPAFTELKGKPLSTGTLVDIKVEKTADGHDYKAIFIKGHRAGALTAKPKKPRQLNLKGAHATKLKPLNPPDLAGYLTKEIMQHLGDPKSERMYRKVATYCSQDLIYRLLSETKQDALEGRIDNKGAIFITKLKQHAPHLFKQKQSPP